MYVKDLPISLKGRLVTVTVTKGDRYGLNEHQYIFITLEDITILNAAFR
jgi:hypothetical protein